MSTKAATVSTSILAVLCLALLSALPAVAQGGQGRPEVLPEVKHDVSPPLGKIEPMREKLGQRVKPLLPTHPHQIITLQSDPVAQFTAGAKVATTAANNFDGVGQGFTGPQGTFTVNAAPPDTNGAVGTTQFVQWVNESFAVFDKSTGTAVYGPAAGNTLWKGFGGPCETNNDGDPIAQYDKAANRWVMTQFSVTGGPPFYQCVAVSTTSDATGTFNRYAFPMPNFPDYPKLGVWPDAYYMSFNMFSGNFFAGARACALDRTAMLSGASANAICFQQGTSVASLLPSDLDGSTAPPASSPNYFLNFGTNSLNLWKFHVDFATPGNSTFTGPTNLPTAAFNEACGGGACIPQSGTRQQLDSLGDRLMYRLAYRNFGDHESLVVNHSVAVGSTVGVRWYELQNPGTNPVVYQQGTYTPDSNFRWMGSLAMDQAGNMALGYSVSSSAMHPAIRYTGRVPTDPLGTMEGETSIIEGTGSQLRNLNRWGDYSSISIDPVDDCTFWYTNEYLQTSGIFNWSTRVASFKFPSCGTAATPDFSLAATPASQTVVQGASTSYTVTVTASGGFNGTVNFSVSALPSGSTANFSPASVTGSGFSTMTVASGTATPGTYPLTITGTNGTLIHTVSVTLVVASPGTGDFSLAASPASQTVPRGSSISYTATVTSSGGFTGDVTFSVSGLPPRSTGSFSPNPVTGGSGSCTLTVTTGRKTPPGTYTLTITGTSGSLLHSITVTLIVN